TGTLPQPAVSPCCPAPPIRYRVLPAAECSRRIPGAALRRAVRSSAACGSISPIPTTFAVLRQSRPARAFVPWTTSHRASLVASSPLSARTQFRVGRPARSRPLASGVSASQAQVFQAFVSGISRGPSVAERSCNLMHDFLTIFGQPPPVLSRHLHPLRRGFLIGFQRFGRGAGRSQLGPQFRPEIDFRFHARTPCAASLLVGVDNLFLHAEHGISLILAQLEK